MIDATPPDAFIGRAAQKKTPISQALQGQITTLSGRMPRMR